MTIRIGVVGLGMMGRTHLDAYAALAAAGEDVRVVAVSDADPARLSGTAAVAGNIPGQAQGAFDLSAVRRHAQADDLLADPDVDLVDLCVWTPLHAPLAQQALAAGKHVLVEKPLTRTVADALALVAAADRARTCIMPAMCLRFWPAYEWLHADVITAQRFGRIRAAHFQREAAHPGGPFYRDGVACGGALLDLHIHDIDMIQWCFGRPSAVTSQGFTRDGTEPDFVHSTYRFADPAAPIAVSATGTWAHAPGFPFRMGYTILCDQASIVFDSAAVDPLVVYADGQRRVIPLDAELGYVREIRYLLACVRAGRAPQRVTVRDAAAGLVIAAAERESLVRGTPVGVDIPAALR